MARATVGLDIGTSAVRAAEIRAGDPPTLIRFAQLSLPPGAVADGEVLDVDMVSQIVKDLWKRGLFKTRRVAVGIANQKVVVRQVELPRMQEEDLQGALRYQVQDFIPIPIEDALLDYLPLEEFLNEEGEPMMRLLTVAAHREMIGSIVAAVERAGLDPVSVDLAPLAATRALAEPFPSLAGDREADVLVDIGAGVTSLVVHEHGLPRFVRIIQGGGGSITEMVSTELRLDPADGEARKISTGLTPEGAAPGDEVAAVIERAAAVFMDEIRRSVEYYEQQPGTAPVARVTLTGGGARLRRLPDRLAAMLGKPVEMGQPLARIQVGDIGLTPEQVEQISVVAAVAVGLALEE